MEVTREEQPEVFRPIIIRLKTRGEAEDMWHILNCGTSTPLNTYCKELGLPHIGNGGYWSALNRVFHP